MLRSHDITAISAFGDLSWVHASITSATARRALTADTVISITLHSTAGEHPTTITPLLRLVGARAAFEPTDRDDLASYQMRLAFSGPGRLVFHPGTPGLQGEPLILGGSCRDTDFRAEPGIGPDTLDSMLARLDAQIPRLTSPEEAERIATNDIPSPATCQTTAAWSADGFVVATLDEQTRALLTPFGHALHADDLLILPPLSVDGVAEGLTLVIASRWRQSEAQHAQSTAHPQAPSTKPITTSRATRARKPTASAAVTAPKAAAKVAVKSAAKVDARGRTPR